MNAVTHYEWYFNLILNSTGSQCSEWMTLKDRTLKS